VPSNFLLFRQQPQPTRKSPRGGGDDRSVLVGSMLRRPSSSSREPPRRLCWLLLDWIPSSVSHLPRPMNTPSNPATTHSVDVAQDTPYPLTPRFFVQTADGPAAGSTEVNTWGVA
jgi:hypothetical protein